VEILPFTGDNFAQVLANDFTDAKEIKTKNHFNYLMLYLGAGGLNAVSMVVEKEYISKDFLHDYAAYYALCFKRYDKFCKRVHFFRTSLTREQFEQSLLGRLDKAVDIWPHYLGFIVVKPIPSTVIGYTVLRNYNYVDDQPHRQFWGLRRYKVHIFGHEEEFESLAFQEQDHVLAACATTAIWSMLNKAAADYHTVLKSPNEITKDAGRMAWDGSRMFPNKGLIINQVCQAIVHSGLETEVKKPDGIPEDQKENVESNQFVSNTYTKKILHAYAGIGIPIILIIQVPNGDEVGMHAIAVSGHSMKPIAAEVHQHETRWLSANTEKFYAHDDQFGPFVRINFEKSFDLKTPWSEQHDKKLPTRVKAIIVSLYPKVRISYEDVEAIVIGLDYVLSRFFDGKFAHDLVWDVRLQLSENFKKEIAESTLHDQGKLQLLDECMPKYLWTASCYVGEIRILTFTFDATDVINGMIGRNVINFLPDHVKTTLGEFLELNKTTLGKDAFVNDSPTGYYAFLLKKLKE
jgi:hypothetical protein